MIVTVLGTELRELTQQQQTFIGEDNPVVRHFNAISQDLKKAANSGLSSLQVAVKAMHQDILFSLINELRVQKVETHMIGMEKAQGQDSLDIVDAVFRVSW